MFTKTCCSSKMPVTLPFTNLDRQNLQLARFFYDLERFLRPQLVTRNIAFTASITSVIVASMDCSIDCDSAPCAPFNLES